ncbi:response regulator transcription factor [Actinoplanes utahensis]|uniref:response regulator transcription factor n=1 Tax=Actinoplanes utahensis TaxID=1869 RepID=UPI0009FDD1C5|nr:response regulator [Actinoplanes utahensis]GIF30042.1 hypothetical protein Aut01nite_30280 [Actinoplanes utahensis]
MASVLAVDDDPTLLRIVETVLKPAGFDVTSRNTGQAALRAAAARPPDCVVLSASLDPAGHDLDAAAVCGALRADPATAGVPVLLLTARGSWLDAAAAFDVGADDYLPKPFAAQDLLSRVQDLTAIGEAPVSVPVSMPGAVGAQQLP